MGEAWRHWLDKAREIELRDGSRLTFAERDLPDLGGHPLPTVNLYRDQLIQFRQSYALAMAALSALFGRDVRELAPLDVFQLAAKREYELDAVRADLDELISKLPRCSFPGCAAHATRTDVNCEDVCDDTAHGAYGSLDPHDSEGPGPEYDLPWASLIRRLEKPHA